MFGESHAAHALLRKAWDTSDENPRHGEEQQQPSEDDGGRLHQPRDEPAEGSATVEERAKIEQEEAAPSADGHPLCLRCGIGSVAAASANKYCVPCEDLMELQELAEAKRDQPAEASQPGEPGVMRGRDAAQVVYQTPCLWQVVQELACPDVTPDMFAELRKKLPVSGELVFSKDAACTAKSPVVVLFPPSGGWGTTRNMQDQLPVPAIYVKIDVPGNFKMALPQYALELLELLRVHAATSRRRKVLVGFSRGGRWVNELALQYPYLFHAAIVT
jgi:hypothetical protein